MYRQSGSRLRLDDPAIMMARVHYEEWERHAQRQRLIDLARFARPRRSSPLTMLVHWWRARWEPGWPGGRQGQPCHDEVQA
jgi:hypothetical protein